MAPEIYTSIVRNKNPSHRLDFARGCWKYMQGRRKDDQAEGLWRIYDKLYDLTPFIENHPGGPNWLTLTKGTDITEAFEVHHFSNKPKQTLAKFFVRNASQPRNYLITFEENGFYQTLKRRVIEKLKTVDVKKEQMKSKILLDIVIVLMFVLAILAVRVDNIFIKLFITGWAGLFLGWTANLSHNFVHMRDNWHMYAMNLTLNSWRDYRVFHIFSHHMYPNSIADLEISGFELHLRWLPGTAKTKLSVLYSRIVSPLLYALIFHFNQFQRSLGVFLSETRVWFWDELLCYVLPVVMIAVSDFRFRPEWWAVIYIHSLAVVYAGSFVYGFFANNNGHHGPDVVHHGDEFTSLDFGVYQIITQHERTAVTKNLFLTLAFFGQHALHHLFPTLDHAVLKHLEDDFVATCNEFGVELKTITMLGGFRNQFKQLGRKTIIKVEKNEEV